MRRLACVAALALAACPKRPPALGPSLPPEIPEGPASAPAPPPEPDPWAGRTDLIQPPPAQPPAPVALPPITRFTLPNGLQVLLVEDHGQPIVSLDLAVKAGAIDEPREKRSLAAFTAEMLRHGAGARTADQIAETIDSVGGSLHAEAALEWTTVTCEAMAKDAPTCVGLLGDAVIAPRFPEAEMGEVRAELEAQLRHVRDDPAALAREHFDNLLWGDEHPRGWPTTAETIAAVRPKDVKDWHKAWFRPGNALLVVSGDFDPKVLRGRLSSAFGRWPKGQVAARKTWPEPTIEGIRVRLVDKPDQTQSQILVGHLGVSAGDPDFLATETVEYTLGQGAFSSRLMKVVRSQGGKTYSAEASFEGTRGRGEFRAHTFTRNAETLATAKLVIDEIARMKAGGPTADELAAAQANLAGGYPIRLQGARALGRAVLRAELLGLGEAWVREYPTRIAQVTLDQAKAAAAAHLADGLVLVVVGRASEVSPQLAKAGWKVETFSWLDPISKRERDARATQKNAPPDPVRAAQGKKLLDAALAAKGGEARLRAVKDLTSKGSVKIVDHGQAFEGPFVRWFVPGTALRLDIATTTIGKITVTITGASSWVTVADRVQELPKENAGQQYASLWRDRDVVLLRHLEADAVAEALPREKVDGRDHDVVLLRKADGTLETKLFLDPRTRLLTRMEYQERGATQREDYRDYRAVQGIQFAFRQHGEGQGQSIDATTTEIKVNAGVPAGTFDKPAK